MFPSSFFVNLTPLAHADTSRDNHHRGVSQPVPSVEGNARTSVAGERIRDMPGIFQNDKNDDLRNPLNTPSAKNANLL
ncbi:hypothetical protein TNCV_1217921 [Trichonephila clavipes]|nr:hypothetical protein TNCV_1217921 [Trichonephila clavipes]